MRIYSPTALEKGLRATFLDFYFQEDESQKLLDRLAYTVPSESNNEKHEYLGAPPQMAELVGPVEFTPLDSAGYTVDNKTFVSGMEVGRNQLADNRTGSITMRVQQMAAAAAGHVSQSLINLLINGASANAYDGVAYWSTSTGKRTFTNTTAGTGVTAAAIQADLAASKARILKRAADNGEPLFGGTSIVWTVVAPAEIEFVVRQALQATLVNNTTNVMAGFADPIFSPRLTDANDYFLFASAPGVRGLIMQPREPVTFEAQDNPSSDTWFAAEVCRYKARYRAGYGYGLPHAGDRITN